MVAHSDTIQTARVAGKGTYLERSVDNLTNVH